MTARRGWGLPPEETLKEWMEDVSGEDEEAAAAAFDALVKACWEPLCRIGCDVARCWATGEDAAADVLTQIWARRRTLRVRTSGGGYLYRSVVNRSLTEVARLAPLESLDGISGVPGSTGSLENGLYLSELLEFVKLEVDELSGEHAATTWSLIDGRPREEIAEALGVTSGTFAVRAHRLRGALEGLRVRLHEAARS